ncbi:MAG: dihydrolipoamide acetyltransferase family protein [Methyloligellaceae bacterium]
MAEHTIKMPDIGEGIAEAELVEWHVKVGDLVREDDDLAAVMTDKATVEVPSPVDGEITWLGAEIGELIAVGSEIIKIKIAGVVELEQEEEEEEHEEVVAPVRLEKETEQQQEQQNRQQKPLASPAIRKRAQDNGINLAMVAGSGPEGRIVHSDIDNWLEDNDDPASTEHVPEQDVTEIPVIGLRRKIAQHMANAKSRIPHITLVEEVDVTVLEGMRGKLNRSRRDDQPKLTLLPFIMQAMVNAIASYPQINSTYDDDAGIIHQHSYVHTGIATQTTSGLMVPVVRNTETRDVWDCAEEINRISTDARGGTAKREELSGSTITLTSLGALGGIMSTPIINHPEVAIVGINKIQVRPVWDETRFIPRKIMNLSSSFDHRIIDGWDAAHFVQELKKQLEAPHKLMQGR